MAKYGHPIRTLVIFLVVLAGLFVTMAVQHTWSPKLGLDLRGGTTITLTARTTDGGAPTAESLEQARTIVQNRVDSLGVGESEVTTSGDREIQVSVPNVQQDELVRMVGQTAVLSFRAVKFALPTTPEPATNLPLAPAKPLADIPAEQKLSWDPSADQQIQTEFLSWTCNDKFVETPNAPLFSCNREGTMKYLLGPTIVSGQDLKTATAGIPQGQLQWVVNLQFNDQGAKLFEDATRTLSANVPQSQYAPTNSFAIVLDGKTISAPTVNEAIPGGQAQISGSFNEASANELANVLKYGSLPLAFDVSSVDNVSPTLGGDQLRAGIIAGIIGLILVVAFAVLYYRGLALLVVLSLAVAAAATYAIMVLLGQNVGFALNLPGIAGAIVAIGTTADSFIIYFERIRDEVREGRSLRSAVETGWKRSRSTILISDAVNLLSATVLFILAMGGIKGFAFTLGLTTLIDVAIIFCFTKPLMSLLVRTKFFGEGRPFSGLEADRLGVRSLTGRFARRGSRSSAVSARTRTTPKEA